MSALDFSSGIAVSNNSSKSSSSAMAAFYGGEVGNHRVSRLRARAVIISTHERLLRGFAMMQADKVPDAAAVGSIFPTAPANLTRGRVATTASATF
jgi:hypothetical protein